jgi:hypothetical protein
MTTLHCAACSASVRPVPTLSGVWQAAADGVLTCPDWVGHSEEGDYAPLHDPAARDPYAHRKGSPCLYCDDTLGVSDAAVLPPIRPFEYLS